MRTDQELREEIKKHKFNGLYAKTICRKCLEFTVDEDGNTDTAKIVPACPSCFETKDLHESHNKKPQDIYLEELKRLLIVVKEDVAFVAPGDSVELKEAIASAEKVLEG